jgi:hypothetical protein
MSYEYVIVKNKIIGNLAHMYLVLIFVDCPLAVHIIPVLFIQRFMSSLHF